MSSPPQPTPATHGQESVWDYPRPPRLDPVSNLVKVVFNGITIAETTRAIRVLETSHPPGYYLPQSDIQMQYMTINPGRRSFCEFKGVAAYWILDVGGKIASEVGWNYESPTRGYEAIKGYISFYPGRVDACYVDDEKVIPQEGDFYGGWITSKIVGPFKGAPGTRGW